MWYIIRQIFLKGGNIKDAIAYVFKATGNMPTKSEGMKIINIYQDVQKNTGKVIEFPKDKITPFHIPRPGDPKYADSVIKDLKSRDPIDAMKEANSIIGRKNPSYKGPYKNLSDDEAQRILKETDDHIFQRDIKYDEFGDPIKPDPEDMASGGRIGYGLGDLVKKKLRSYTREGIDEAQEEWLKEKGLDLTLEEWQAKSLLEKLKIAGKINLTMIPGVDDLEKGTDYASGGRIGYAEGKSYDAWLNYRLKEIAKGNLPVPFKEWQKGEIEMASGGVAGQLHLNRPGYRLGTRGPGELVQERENRRDMFENFRKWSIDEAIKKTPEGVLTEQVYPDPDIQTADRPIEPEIITEPYDPYAPDSPTWRIHPNVVEFDDGTIYYKNTGEYYLEDGTQVEGPSPGAKPIPKTVEAREGGRIGFASGSGGFTIDIGGNLIYIPKGSIGKFGLKDQIYHGSKGDVLKEDIVSHLHPGGASFNQGGLAHVLGV